jgi:Zn-dependent peptidase ImmA (M78 family)
LSPIIKSSLLVPKYREAVQYVAPFQLAAPVDVVGIATNLGIKVWEASLAPTISGVLKQDAEHGGHSGFVILVNKTEAYARKRFTVAHELAHYFLHRDRLGVGGLQDDTFYRSGLPTEDEYQANALAADILMPYSLIEKLKIEGINSIEGLANKLDVSVAAMKVRLQIPVV